MESEIEQIKGIMEIIQDDQMTHTEFNKFFAEYVKIVKELRIQLEERIAESALGIRRDSNSQIKDVFNSLNSLELSIKDSINSTERTSRLQVKELGQKFSTEMARIERLIPNLTGLDRRINEVESKIPKLPPAIVLDSGERIVDKINELPVDPRNQIDAKHIKNLPVNKAGGYTGVLGIQQISAGSGISIDNSNPHYPVITNTAGGGSLTLSEIPTGDVDGINTVYTLAATPTSLAVYADGLRMIEGVSKDYTVSGVTVTFNSGRQPFSSIICDYLS